MNKRMNPVLGLSVLMLCGLGMYSTIDAAPFAYIPNSGSNTVSVLDIATTPIGVVKTVLAGTNPRGVASAERTSETFTFVTNYGSNNVSVIRTYNDAITNNVVFEEVREVAVGRNPYGIAVDPAGTFAYVTNFGDASVSKIDLSNYIVTAIPVGSNPIGIVVSPDGSKIYAVNNGSNTVSIISAVDNTNIITVAVGINPFGAAVNPAGTFVYVTNSGGNSISVIKTADHSVITKSDFHLANPSGAAVNPSGTLVYITNYGSGTLSFFDASGNTFSSPNIAVGTNPVGVSLSLDGKFTYVANNFDGTIAVIDNTTNTEKLPRIRVGTMPYALGSFVAPFGKTVPTVTSTIPANAATDVSLGTTIQAAFSDIMDAATINGSTFLMSEGITGTVTYNSISKIATFKPLKDLSKNTTYTVTLTTGIRNAMGNALASNYAWSFTTSEKSDGSCFIATAVYGSYDDIHVRVLRTFRDQYLLPHAEGAAIVAFYYQYSPPIAAFIREHPALRAPTRWLLTPVVYFVQYPFHLALLLGLGLVIIAGRKRIRS
ncbi:MAG: Ig-like domain-containing protein [Deltaproteobacteria bacterium]|nr:Ig-like domain-containing protein [Deltaproteobacteria bacterium]